MERFKYYIKEAFAWLLAILIRLFFIVAFIGTFYYLIVTGDYLTRLMVSYLPFPICVSISLILTILLAVGIVKLWPILEELLADIINGV